MKTYEEIPHTADLAVKIYGKDIPSIFENAAHAMFDIIRFDVKEPALQDTAKIELQALDTDSLLVSWLNELLYVSVSKHILFSEFHVALLTKNKLIAQARGRKTKKHIYPKIKAATYHNVNIKKTKTGYETIIIFDV